MSKAEKIGEPSMEEILSSIRKIIAEDPSGARAPVAAQARPQPAAPRPEPRSPEPRSPEPRPMAAAQAPYSSAPQPARQPASEPMNMDDVLGLADDARPVKAPAPADMDRTTPSWLFPKSSPATVSPAAAETQPARQPEAARPAVKPFFPPQTRETEPAPAPMPYPGQANGASATRGLNDLGAVVPGRADMQRAAPAPKPMPDRISAEAPARAPQPSPAAHQTIDPPAAATPSAQSKDLAGLNGYRPLPQPQPVATEPLAATPVTAKAAAPVVEPAPRVTQAAALAITAPIASAAMPEAPAQQAAAPAPRAEPLTPPATSAFDPPAKAAPVASTPASAEAPVAAKPEPAAAPVAAPMPSTSKPSSPIAAQPEAALAAPEALGETVRTMEDTVAELLRPMLRQWLDTNMPRIVEKALRVEMAASLKPKPEPAKH